MNNQNQQSIGEAQITPGVQNQITPDVVSPEGKQQLFESLGKATVSKGGLDFILSGIANKVGAEFTSRVKNPETVVQKIAQKRMQGRNYGIQDVNDNYGGRFIIKNSSQASRIKTMLTKAQDLGIFKINKQEDVTKDTYHAFHVDFTTSDGVKGEVQIMKPQEVLESVANHSLRSVFGENPPNQVQNLRDMQANMAKNMPDNSAVEKAAQIQNIAKANGDQPLDPRIIASTLQS